MKKRVWSKSACLNYLRAFDAFEHKYQFNADDELDNAKRNAWDDILNSQSHGISNHNFSRAEEAEATQGIEQVYRDSEHYTNEYIEMLNLVRDKFIFDYTGISGLCDFFSPAYFEFEWGMHLEIDYDKHISRFYRDHYIHQIRNLYEMFTLLDDFDYYKKCKEAYIDPENNIGTYILESIQQEILSLNSKDIELYGRILSISNQQICEETGEKIKNITATAGSDKYSEALSAIYKSAANNHRKELSMLMLRHVVYSAVIIASLVHDIGYPISYIRRVGDRFNKNLPINTLLAATNNDYSEIERALQNSLLFSIVDHDKIKRRLNNSDEHGAQSAIVLLMYFHQQGGTLSMLQKCAVEVAALVIYNHTNKFWVIDKEKDSPELVRSDIHKAPISHLFRLCDDLQEWDRVYFEITDKSNIMICPKCHTPITRKYGTDINKPEEKHYYCCCTDSDKGVYDTNAFVSRRIINVIGCDSMQVEAIAPDCLSRGTKYILNYDCAALLNTMTFSTSNAKVRAKGIKNLKRLHSYQGMYDSILVESFVSGNPFTVKIRILEQYVALLCEMNNWPIVDFNKHIRKIKNSITQLYFLNGDHTEITKLWKANLQFYLNLRKIGIEFKNIYKTIVSEFRLIENEQSSCIVKDNTNAIKSYLGYFAKDSNPKQWYNSLGVNTTNKEVLDDYSKIYEKLSCVLNSIAKNNLVSGNMKDYFADETMLELGRDYLMHQAHVQAYEEIEKVLRGDPEAETDVRLQNIYRQFYEQLNCCEDYLCNQVNKYISRSKYDWVKNEFNENNSDLIIASKHIDFFVDYALFIKLWDEVNMTKNSYFGREGKSADYILHPAAGDKSSVYPQLICKTPKEEFVDRYDFEIIWNEGGTDDSPAIVSMIIDWNNRTAVLDSSMLKGGNITAFNSNKEAIYELLQPLTGHHRIIL